MRHTVGAATTLGACLAALLPGASSTTRKQMCAAGRVCVNGTAVRDPRRGLAAGDVVEVGARRAAPRLGGGVAIVHEDADVLVILKPPGLLTIATARERARTAYAYLTALLAARRPRERVFIVHRLDRDASGLLVLAKSPAAKHALQAAFAAHAVERTYVAVVEGAVGRPHGVIESRLLDAAPGRVRVSQGAEGRPAVTRWRLLRAGARRSLLEVRLETGRRNQIRAHLASVGHPIVGDGVYGARTPGAERLALHAQSLGFTHPTTGARLRFASEPPASFGRLV